MLLTAILTPVVILASWNDGDDGRWGVNAFFAWMLALEGLAIGVFAATDVFLFYVLFEATLIPIYFLIGGFGGPRRSYAAVKFLLFSLFGGLLMLASVVGLYVVSAARRHARRTCSPSSRKIPIGPGHRPLAVPRLLRRVRDQGADVAGAHLAARTPPSEATPGTSVLLVSILDKIGTFGMIRFCLELFPEASQWATPVVLVLAVISVLYGALAAIGQNDIPRLIAYTSVSHFGFIVLGIFVLNSYGQAGSTLYMFNHGLSTAALFLVTGFLISRRGSKLIPRLRRRREGRPGAGRHLPGRRAVVAVAAGPVAVHLGVPGAAGRVHAQLVVRRRSRSLGIVLAALYILLMYQRTMTGPPRARRSSACKDLERPRGRRARAAARADRACSASSRSR